MEFELSIMSSAILKEIYNAAILASLSFFLHRLLIFCNFNWAKQKTYFLVILLLPIITMSITKVISTNVALSLGLVGALSIVRFRHPVRTSVELTIFFLLISSGIIASQSINRAILLFAISYGIILVSKFYSKVGAHQSFEEEFNTDPKNPILVTLILKGNSKEAKEFPGLISYSIEGEEKTFNYRTEKNGLHQIEKFVESQKNNLISFEVRK